MKIQISNKISIAVFFLSLLAVMPSCGGGGGGGSQGSVVDTGAAAAPDGVAPEQVTLYKPMGRTSSSMRLTWMPSEEADFASYKLYRSVSSNVSSASTLVSTITDQDTVNVSDDGLSNSTTYYYKLYVCDTGGLCTESNETSNTTMSDRYSVSQGISDNAQGTTIAFSALANMTGDMCADTFLPPGKVADFQGFQYFRDTDAGGLGHSGVFVPRVANLMLSILTVGEIQTMMNLAQDQVDTINQFAYDRYPLIQAFRRNLAGDIPDGTTGLSKQAVIDYVGNLFRVDGELSYERAQVLGGIIRNLTDEQRATLNEYAAMNGSLEWPEMEDQLSAKGFTNLSQDVSVAMSTYASEMFTWYAGSVESDTYFCPERHGTYFGSFYMKDMPAMQDPNYAINEAITGDVGRQFMDDVLTSAQSQLISGIVDLQKTALEQMVAQRAAIAAQLRRFMEEETVDKDTVLALAGKYGELDGEISYYYASRFAQVYQSLTDEQKTAMANQRLHVQDYGSYPCSGAYLYSQNVSMPDIENTDFLFGADSAVSSQALDYNTCINQTGADTTCKDCCDCMDGSADDRKTCRDDCAIHDFTANSSYVNFDVPSALGAGGDYSTCVAEGTESDCKRCCDGGTMGLACGDFRFCRDACNAAYGG